MSVRDGVRRALAAAVLLWVVGAPAAAQTPGAQDPGGQPASSVQQRPRAALPPRVGIESDTALSLAEAVRLALANNNDVAIARLGREDAAASIRAAEGVFEPRLLPSLSFQRVTSPVVSVIGGASNGRVEERRLVGDVQLAGRSPWAGGRFTLDFTSTRLESTNQNLRLNPQFPSALGVSYVQPLFRGREIDQERREILLARRTAELSAAELRLVLTEQLALVEQAYWDLVFAARNLEVQATALDQARAQVASNERQVLQGALAPIDVVEAEIQVARFEQAVATAQQTLTEAENRVKALVLADRRSPMWSQALDPVTLTDRSIPEIDIERAVQASMARRPEMEELQTLEARTAIDRRFFADQARPQIDLAGSYSLAGLSGTPVQQGSSPFRSSLDPAVLARLNDLSVRAGFDPLELAPVQSGTTIPDFFVGGVGGSLSNVWGRRFPSASVQVQIELPLLNRTAEANLARVDIAARQIARQRSQLEQAIEAEVRNAAQAIASSRLRLDAARSAHRKAREQYESERRRFESGLSTVFLVLERQTALVTAQAQELRARADLNQAIVLFDRATGTTLEHHAVRLD